MNSKLLIFVYCCLLYSCNKQAQIGNLRYAIEMYSKCNFESSLQGANDVIAGGDSQKTIYVQAQVIKGLSLEQLNKKKEASKVFEEIAKANENISSFADIRKTHSDLFAIAAHCSN